MPEDKSMEITFCLLNCVLKTFITVQKSYPFSNKTLTEKMAVLCTSNQTVGNLHD